MFLACRETRIRVQTPSRRTMVQVEKYDSYVSRILLNGVRACYVIRSDRVALIDCGFPNEYRDLLAGLQLLGLRLHDVDILALTHVHMDHIGCAGHLARDHPGLKVFVHEYGPRHLMRPERLNAAVEKAYGALFHQIGKLVPIDTGNREVVGVLTGDIIDLGTRSLHVLETPGHAKHHVVFHDRQGRGVFTGDAMGSKYVGLPNFVLTPPADYDPDLSKESVEQIGRLRAKMLWFAHNGPYYLPENGYLFDRLKQQHDLWTNTVSDLMSERPEADRHEMLDLFLEKRPELKRHVSQRFSFGLSVAGIMKYLRK